jgi:hypothetical protein
MLNKLKIDVGLEKIIIYEIYLRYYHKYIHHILVYGPMALIIILIFIKGIFNVNYLIIITLSYFVIILNMSRLSNNIIEYKTVNKIKNEITNVITKRGLYKRSEDR